MALSIASSSNSLSLISYPYKGPKKSLIFNRVILCLASSADESSRTSDSLSAKSNSRARFVARRTETVSVRQLERPLSNVRIAILFDLIMVRLFDDVNWIFYFGLFR